MTEKEKEKKKACLIEKQKLLLFSLLLLMTLWITVCGVSWGREHVVSGKNNSFKSFSCFRKAIMALFNTEERPRPPGPGSSARTGRPRSTLLATRMPSSPRPNLYLAAFSPRPNSRVSRLAHENKWKLPLPPEWEAQPRSSHTASPLRTPPALNPQNSAHHPGPNEHSVSGLQGWGRIAIHSPPFQAERGRTTCLPRPLNCHRVYVYYRATDGTLISITNLLINILTTKK